ncbi:MAG: molybdopterin molybdotransferase MoeA [Eubacterium sp.]|nr:molybdopterin molybdotransferase MoeA [Eubacterium sp.]
MLKKKMDYQEAMELLIRRVSPVGIEEVPLEKCAGRILGADITATENVPSFDRSPYDGYAFRAGDTAGVSEGNPVTLRVLENIRAGQMPRQEVVPGTAIRLMTGAPVPVGADAICKYEDTEFTEESVTLKQSYRPGENIVTAGEDIRQGTPVLEKGYRIDPGMVGTLASLGVMQVPVFRKPVVGILSTGDEVVEAGEPLPPGKIRNSNRYTIAAALESIGMETIYLGQAEDSTESIAGLIRRGEQGAAGSDSSVPSVPPCDVLISTGGVSVGDYDLVPDAMETCGYEILTGGVAMKPGMACAYGVKTMTVANEAQDRLMLGLSGNPASSLTNLQCVCFPALRKMTGQKEFEHSMLRVKLGCDILKTGKGTRFVRGRTVIREGEIVFEAPSVQGNVVISSAARCDAYAVLTGMKAPVKEGTMVEVFTVRGGAV